MRSNAQYEDQQAALVAAREDEERRRREMEEQQRREFEQRQAEQAERERLAQEQLLQQQMQQQMMQYSNQAAQQMHDLERELLAMRGHYERDQLMLEQYDRVGRRKLCLWISALTTLSESQSFGKRAQQCLDQHQLPNDVERRPHPATPGSGYDVAEEV